MIAAQNISIPPWIWTLMGGLVSIVFLLLIGVLGYMLKSYIDRRYKREDELTAEDRTIHANIVALTISSVRTEEKIDGIVTAIAALPCRAGGNNIPPGTIPSPTCPVRNDE